MTTNYTQDASCQAAYLFAEGTGTSVDDASPNTNTGTFKAVVNLLGVLLSPIIMLLEVSMAIS